MSEKLSRGARTPDELQARPEDLGPEVQAETFESGTPETIPATPSPEESLAALDEKIESNDNRVRGLDESIVTTKTRLNEVRGELGMPPSEENPPSVATSMEKSTFLKNESDVLKSQRESLVRKETDPGKESPRGASIDKAEKEISAVDWSKYKALNKVDPSKTARNFIGDPIGPFPEFTDLKIESAYSNAIRPENHDANMLEFLRKYPEESRQSVEVMNTLYPGRETHLSRAVKQNKELQTRGESTDFTKGKVIDSANRSATEKNIGVPFRGDWEKGERPEGWRAIDERYQDLKPKGFSTKKTLGEDFVSKYNDVLLKAKYGKLTSDETASLVEYNTAIHEAMDKFQSPNIPKKPETVAYADSKETLQNPPLDQEKSPNAESTEPISDEGQLSKVAPEAVSISDAETKKDAGQAERENLDQSPELEKPEQRNINPVQAGQETGQPEQKPNAEVKPADEMQPEQKPEMSKQEEAESTVSPESLTFTPNLEQHQAPQENIIDERILKRGIEDFSKSFQPLISALVMRQENRLSELIPDNYIRGLSSGLSELREMDFTKPESFENIQRPLNWIIKGLELIGSQPARGAVRDSLDNLGYLLSSLKTVQEGSANLRSGFGKLDMPESKIIVKMAGRLQDVAEEKMRYIHRRMDAFDAYNRR